MRASTNQEKLNESAEISLLTDAFVVAGGAIYQAAIGESPTVEIKTYKSRALEYRARMAGYKTKRTLQREHGGKQK